MNPADETTPTEPAGDTIPVKYIMTISRLTVDKLGVKLYDKVSAVLAELIANSYDADSTQAIIRAPMGQFLATKANRTVLDKGFCIEVEDNGTGMNPYQVNEFYLRVGAERRNDPRRGAKSHRFGRRVMGRKGVGKLAPFGICQRIEVLSSGGERIRGLDENGEEIEGYQTAHLFLDREGILRDVDFDYNPDVGPLDGMVRPNTGTLLRLTMFSYRQVPDIAALERELSQKFGLRAENWEVRLVDSTKTENDPNYSRYVGEFEIPTMPHTTIRFETEKEPDGRAKEPPAYTAIDPQNNPISDLTAGFWHDGDFYPVTGWVAYAAHHYKDDLMAGVRIYCHGKIAAQTNIFNRGAGFTGEYDIRSYLVGELHAEWLDEQEDLIQTDRRDILWSHELGMAFQEWGQGVVARIGKISRKPIQKKAWDRFREVSNIEDRIREAFPRDDQKPIRDRAVEFARLFGQNLRDEEIENPDRAGEIVQLTLLIAPHVTLDDKLREAASASPSPLAYIVEILETARIAELASLGRIADDRVRIIERVEELKDDPNTPEMVIQKLITAAPWLIDPQWTPLTANRTFATLRTEFVKYFKLQTRQDIELGDFPFHTRRADFVLATQENSIQIIEIKEPHHKFENEEMERLDTYITQMAAFLDEPGHRQFKDIFNSFHVTLICDELNLTGTARSSFQGYTQRGIVTHLDWTAFFLKTTRMHRDFLDEAERLKRDTARRN